MAFPENSPRSPTSTYPYVSSQEKGVNVLVGLPWIHPDILALPEEMRKDIQDMLQKIEIVYPNASEQKNQRDKFLNSILTGIDKDDTDMTKVGIESEIKSWKAIISSVHIDQEKTQKVQTETQKVQTESQTSEEKTQIVQSNLATNIQTAESLKKYQESYTRLTQKISSLSGGKSVAELIPDYQNKLERSRQDLVASGQDPRHAEGVLLISYQEDIFKNIESERKIKWLEKLRPEEYNELKKTFTEFRGMIPREISVPEKSATNIALADPKVTLEAYSKIKLWFEPPTQLVHASGKTGEITSQPAILTGERTIMTPTGDRFREKSGIRIPSPVPSISEAETLLQNLNVSRQELTKRTKNTEVIARVTQWEITEQFPKQQFPNLNLPPLDTQNPENLQKQLLVFFQSSGYQELRQNPDIQRKREDLESRLRNLYQSVTTQSELIKNISLTEAKKPEEIVRARIAEQDRTIDSNLSRLTRLGMGALGQEKYEKVRDTLNKKLRTEATPGIEDQEPISELQVQLLKEALLKLTNMTEAEMYPDGSISPAAANKLGNVSREGIEGVLLGNK